MSQAIRTLQIGDRAYTVGQLPPMRAIRLLPRIGKALGPALGVLVAGSGGVASLLSMDLSKVDVAGALQGLFENLTSDELEGLTRELLATAKLNGQDLLPQFDLVMQGRVFEIFQLLKFAFEVNFVNFSGALPGNGG